MKTIYVLVCLLAWHSLNTVFAGQNTATLQLLGEQSLTAKNTVMVTPSVTGPINASAAFDDLQKRWETGKELSLGEIPSDRAKPKLQLYFVHKEPSDSAYAPRDIYLETNYSNFGPAFGQMEIGKVLRVGHFAITVTAAAAARLHSIYLEPTDNSGHLQITARVEFHKNGNYIIGKTEISGYTQALTGLNRSGYIYTLIK